MKAMRMILLHGRTDPDAEMDDWGFKGPVIDGITAVHWTYGSTITLYFAKRIQAARARTDTGWEWQWEGGTPAVSVPVVNGEFIMTPAEPSTKVGPRYYGDFELQTVNGAGKEVGNVE